MNKGIFNELWDKTKETSSLPLVSLQREKGNLALQRDTLHSLPEEIYEAHAWEVAAC